ncbi:MAG: hypothetical protein ACRDKU_05845 [Gaiellaceae bacterium]
MRHVDPVPPPTVLDGADSPGGKETARARELYENKPQNADAKFTYSVYSRPSVKDKLNELFFFKCAYCESYFGHVHPLDVEHFRPKGGYVLVRRTKKAELKKPGYYWLAADWSNLFPSCIDCNRERTQTFRSEPPELSGKANKFPLRSERKRAKKPGKESRERPLLLNPYLDDPQEHVTFDNQGIVRPVLDPQGRESKMGRTSIKTYGLQREGLALERERVALETRASMKRIDKLSEIFEDTGNAEIQAMLTDEIAYLKAKLRPQDPYSAMVNEIVEPLRSRFPI